MEIAPHHERISDKIFRKAVDLLDRGDAIGLYTHLQEYPDLVYQHILFENSNYFENPSLLEFIAENPVRHGILPKNIVEIARIILEAGAKKDITKINETLELVCSSRISNECKVQIPLITILCDYGANPDNGMMAALCHGEFDALKKLISMGAIVNLPVTAATGRLNNFEKLFPDSSSEERHLAFAFAAQYGHIEIMRMLLSVGEDPNRYNPAGAHAHSTPLHQAVIFGHKDVVQLLVENGARLDMKDIIYHGTALEWAKYGKFPEIEAYLQSC